MEMTEGQPYRAECVCGKKVTITKKGAPRAHACTNPGGPGWPEDAAPAQPVVPADVEETEIFDKPVDPTKVRDGRLTPAGNNAPGDFFAKYRVMEGVTGFPLACGHTAKGRDVVRARTDVHDTYECEGGCNGDREPKPTMRELIDQMSPESPARLTGGADDTASHASGVPLDAVEKGAWFGAMYAGGIACGHRVEEGDLIRADGEGGFECEEFCGQDDDAPHVHQYAYMDDSNGHSGSYCECGQPENWNGTGRARPSASTVKLPAQEPRELAPRLLETIAREQKTLKSRADSVTSFLGSSAPAKAPAAGTAQAVADFFATPPPEETAAKERKLVHPQSGYMLKDPTTGDFRRYQNGKHKGVTRTTTFNKSASDRTALTDWNKRNVLAGASLRPDLVLKAHGLDVKKDAKALNAIVAELEEAAGAKVSASIGTAVHKLTERLDRGEITLAQVPEAYRRHLTAYRDALAAAGLEVVPELIERTVFFQYFGGVAGSFDRVLYHRASNTYLMGDLKTGENLEYGWDEIETQEFVYATGYNQFGTYVWDMTVECDEKGYPLTEPQDYWEPPKFQLSMEEGIVMHLPVQGENAGTCTILRTDLKRGRDHALLCGQVREGRKAKGKPVTWTPPAPPAPGSPEWWQARFHGVSTEEEAAALWTEAVGAGLLADFLTPLVQMVKEQLTAR
jgi:hypothetical protein